MKSCIVRILFSCIAFIYLLVPSVSAEEDEGISIFDSLLDGIIFEDDFGSFDEEDFSFDEFDSTDDEDAFLDDISEDLIQSDDYDVDTSEELWQDEIINFLDNLWEESVSESFDEVLWEDFSMEDVQSQQDTLVRSGEYSSCSVIDDMLFQYDTNGQISKFIDIWESLYKDDIAKIEKAQVIDGRTATTFDPFEPLTRAEFLAVALKTHCIDVSAPAIHPFTDVEATGWKSRVIGKALFEGIISWETNSSGQRVFRPNDSITRMEVVAILLKLSKQDIPWDRVSPYTDIASQQWQKNYVTRWNELGLFMPEKTHNRFYPNRFINREHIATVLFKLVELYR